MKSSHSGWGIYLHVMRQIIYFNLFLRVVYTMVFYLEKLIEFLNLILMVPTRKKFRLFQSSIMFNIVNLILEKKI